MMSFLCHLEVGGTKKKSIFDSYTLCLSLFILNVYPYFYLFTGEKAFEYRVDNNNKYIIIIHKI